jgi:hypothetical protein
MLAGIHVAAPEALGDIGINRTLLEELALKMLFLNGEQSLVDLADRMCLSLPVVEEIFHFLRREQLCEVKGIVRGVHVIAATGAGKERGSHLFAFSSYAGPAPVSLEEYSARVRSQSLQNALVEPVQLKQAFKKLVLDDKLLMSLGTAIVSGTSIFLYGPPGTGKTTLACRIPSIYDDSVLIPHAIEVDRQIIAVFDPGVHHRIDESLPDDSDRRWVLCRRPSVVTGGELSSEMLDIQFNAAHVYTAPLQLKANNGVLVIDDFGRQRMRPDELLNRWMTPLDRRIDFLTLPGGRKFEAPFDVLVVFSTNLDPRGLADEAFLRRIPNKINVRYATPQQFAEVFEKECAARMVRSEAGLAEYLVALIAEMNQPLAHSHAHDIVNQIFWSATYRGVPAKLNRTALEQACRNYFLPVENSSFK